MYRKIIDKLKNKNVAILGFGMEGKSTYRFIRKYLHNQNITIIDKNDVLKNNYELLKDDNNINYVIGDNYLSNLDKYDIIIKSPGISFKDINISNIKTKITSQLELLLEVDKENVIGVTGTKGKSTTSSLIYQVLKDQNYKTYLLGNIGNPIFDEIENYDNDTKLVVEMSSHQLEFIKVSPHTGIILNLFEDHLDHAGSVKHYHECKMHMFDYQNSDDVAIYSKDNETLNNYVLNNNYKSTLYSVSLSDNASINIKDDYVYFENEKLYNINDKRNLLGNHNLSNITFVLLVVKLLKLDFNKAINTINNFESLKHRLEYVGEFDEIKYYDDAIATIPAATINAIKALKNVNTLILGGMDRGIEYESLIEFLKDSNIDNLICMPTTGYNIGEKLKDTNKNIYFIESLDDAVKKAKEVTKKQSICLLSPAAASYEYFKNFEEKGNCFQKLVKKTNCDK